MLETQQWVEDIHSKVIKHVLPLAGLLVVLQCNNLVMDMDSLEHILVQHLNIMHLSLLILAILLNWHLVDIPPIGINQLLHQLSRPLREVVMITIPNNPHTSSKTLVVLLRQRTLATIMASHLFQAIISKDKAILRMVMVDIRHHLNLGMASHQHMINMVILQPTTVM